jgi:hypothetical protein
MSETNSSHWKKVHPTFKVHSIFQGGKQGSGSHKNKIYNQIRLVTIEGFAYLEVKTQKTNITFLCDISNYSKLRQHTWITNKHKNTYYIKTDIKKNNKRTTLRFHCLIYSQYKIIDHINRQGTDNRECNLRETTHKQNMLNCRLRKNNTSGYNGIIYHKINKAWRFSWSEKKKLKYKSFKTKEEAIEFKLAHDLTTGNMNGYLL